MRRQAVLRLARTLRLLCVVSGPQFSQFSQFYIEKSWTCSVPSARSVHSTRTTDRGAEMCDWQHIPPSQFFSPTIGTPPYPHPPANDEVKPLSRRSFFAQPGGPGFPSPRSLCMAPWHPSRPLARLPGPLSRPLACHSHGNKSSNHLSLHP